MEIDVLQDLAFIAIVAVGEADIVEYDLAGELLEGDCIGLLEYLVLLVHETEDGF